MLSPLPVILDGQSLSPADVVAVARHGERVSLGPQAKTRLQQARRLVVRGFFGEILQKITVTQVRERLAVAIEAELEAVGV